MKGIYDVLFKEKSAVWTALFTGALVLFSWLLYRSSDQAGQNSIAVDRAFLTTGGIGTIAKNVQNNLVVGYSFPVNWGNSGTTPTRSGAYEVNVTALDSAPNDQTAFDSLPQSEKTPFVFGPKQIIVSAAYMSLSDLEDASQGRKHAFLWGWAVYRDVFPKTPVRVSEFCMEIENVTWSASNHADPHTELSVGNTPCRVHNCYDEDCKDYDRMTNELQ
jgi:hypothetical protein